MTSKAMGPSLILGSMTASASVSGLSILDKLETHAAAYGLIVSFCIGIIGVAIHAVNGYLTRKEQRRFNDATLENQRKVLRDEQELH